MKLAASARFGMALILTLMLPLRGFAAVLLCAADAAVAHSSILSAAMPHDMTRMSPTSASVHHVHPVPAQPHGQSTHVHAATCGDCCCTAGITSRTAHWEAPRASASELDAPRLPSALAVLLDGLERPPRR